MRHPCPDVAIQLGQQRRRAPIVNAAAFKCRQAFFKKTHGVVWYFSSSSAWRGGVSRWAATLKGAAPLQCGMLAPASLLEDHGRRHLQREPVLHVVRNLAARGT